jgi:hypothetical protein
MRSWNPLEFKQLDNMTALLAAGVHASNLGICLLDSQTRFESVNAALAHETRASVEHHVGKSSREIVGDLATQIEPTYEKVLRTGNPVSVTLVGRVRDTRETGYWLDYCFPIFDKSQRVQQLGLLVVNVTAERASTEILNALPKALMPQNSGLLETLDESISAYYCRLVKSLEALSCSSTEAARRADGFRLSLEQLDDDIRLMRELIYAVIAKLQILEC